MGYFGIRSKGECTLISHALDSWQVQILHDLCEWQLDNPARFRALLKTEDEEATWVRIDTASASC